MRNQRSLVIDGVGLSDEPTALSSEVGHNHQGDVKKCKELFRQAKECGVDAVKTQKRDNRTLYTGAMYDKPCETENSFGATYGEHREARSSAGTSTSSFSAMLGKAG